MTTIFSKYITILQLNEISVYAKNPQNHSLAISILVCQCSMQVFRRTYSCLGYVCGVRIVLIVYTASIGLVRCAHRTHISGSYRYVDMLAYYTGIPCWYSTSTLFGIIPNDQLHFGNGMLNVQYIFSSKINK